MATNTWLSRALARAQVDTLTPGGTIEVGDIFIVTINGKSCSYSATGTTVASVCTGLAAALTAMTAAEFTEITFTDSTTTVTATGGTAGLPFTITATTTESNGGAADAQTFVQATTTAATGPNHWDDVNNWSLGAIPANTNDVDIDLARGSILYGLGQSAVTAATLDIYSSGETANEIGLPEINVDGGYTEYRTKDLQIGATLARFNSRSPFVRIDFGSVQTAVEVRATGTESGDGVPALLLKGTHASNTFEFKSGTSGLGYFLGESCSASVTRVSPEASLIVGELVSLVTVTSLGTTLIQTSGAGTTLTVEEGTTRVIGTSAWTTLNADGGVCYYESSGTVSTANIGPGTVDCSGDISPRTFSVTNLEVGGQIIDPNQTITHTAGVARTARVKEMTAA